MGRSAAKNRIKKCPHRTQSQEVGGKGQWSARPRNPSRIRHIGHSRRKSAEVGEPKEPIENPPIQNPAGCGSVFIGLQRRVALRDADSLRLCELRLPPPLLRARLGFPGESQRVARNREAELLDGLLRRVASAGFGQLLRDLPVGQAEPTLPAHAEQSPSLGERHCVPTCLRSLLCLAPDPGWPRQEKVRRKVRKNPKIEIDTTDKGIRKLPGQSVS